MNFARLRSIVQVLGGLATAIGVVLGVLEYRNQGQAARAAETLDLIDYWEVQGARQAYAELTSIVLNQRSQLTEAEAAALSGDDREARRRVVELVAARVMRQDGSEENFDTVVYYFTRLALCIEADLCNQDTARVFFTDTLETFVSNFRYEFSTRRDPDTLNFRDSNYADAVLQLNQLLTGANFPE